MHALANCAIDSSHLFVGKLTKSIIYIFKQSTYIYEHICMSPLVIKNQQGLYITVLLITISHIKPCLS